MKPSLALHKIPLYNTGRLDDDDIIAAFAARQGLFDRIAADLSAEKDGGRAQHHLIVGQRGMGKTMLLSRIAAEIRKTSLNERFVPLVFAEEQYAVDRLSKFWLNCLDSLADALERQGNPAAAARIDDVVSGFTARFPSAAKDDSPLANEALTEFLNAAAEIGRRPVLLVDNLQLVFERISPQQQHALREVLMRPGSSILIGASPSPPPESQDYGAAFYDHFKVHYLRPLEVEEMQALMLHLAEVIGRDDVRARILSHPQRLKVLRQLTGGNPRTTATLFFLYAEDFAPTVFGDLENLLDRVTPLYKARFEELSAQQQVIASAIANHWDPVTSRILSEVTGLPMTGISGQLDRLEKTGFIERVSLFGQSSTGYQIAERFFNVWFLMRSASRRQRREVEFLTRFLENFYESDDRSRIARCLLDECDFSPDRHLFTKALAATLDDKAVAEDLERHAQLDALRQKAAEARRKLDEILDLSSLPPATLSFNELREKLMSLVPEEASVTPEQFSDAILGDRQMFMSRERERLASSKKKLSSEEITRLLELVITRSKMDEKKYGEDASRFMQLRLSGGQIRALADCQDWSRSIGRCADLKAARILLETIPAHCRDKLSQEAHDSIKRFLDEFESVDYSKFDTSPPMFLFFLLNKETLLKVGRVRLNTIRELKKSFGNGYAVRPDGTILDVTAGETLAILEQITTLAGGILKLMGLALVGLGRGEEAMGAFKEATLENRKDGDSWALLGRTCLELDCYPDEAEDAFQNALGLSSCTVVGHKELLRFYLDKKGDVLIAREVFEKARSSFDEISEEFGLIQEIIFAAYEQDWGFAASSLSKALDFQLDDFAVAEQTEWLRASAALIHLDYGADLLLLLEQRGDHARFRPWYEALRAHHLGDRDYLLNVAPEIRSSAEVLYDAIKERLDKLPESTRRRPLPKAAKKRGKRR